MYLNMRSLAISHTEWIWDSLIGNLPEIRQRVSHIKGAGGSADLKESKSALLSLNHRNFPNTDPIYTN